MVFAAADFAGEYPDVSVTEVKALVATKKVMNIDVNGPESFKKGRVPCAVDCSTIKDDREATLPEDKSR